MIHSFCVSDLKSKHVNVYNKYRNKYFFDEIKKKLQQISKTYLKSQDTSTRYIKKVEG